MNVDEYSLMQSLSNASGGAIGGWRIGGDGGVGGEIGDVEELAGENGFDEPFVSNARHAQAFRRSNPRRVWLFAALRDEIIETSVGLRIRLERGAGVREERGEILDESLVPGDGGRDVAEEFTRTRPVPFARFTLCVERFVRFEDSTLIRARVDPRGFGEARSGGDAVQTFHRPPHLRRDDDDRIDRYIGRRFVEHGASVRANGLFQRVARFTHAGEEKV